MCHLQHSVFCSAIPAARSAKIRLELLLRVDLATGRGGGLRPPCRTQHAIAIEREQAGEETRPRCFRGRLEGVHLHVSFAHAQMIAVPCDGIADDLPVYSGIVTELRLRRARSREAEISLEISANVTSSKSTTLELGGVALALFASVLEFFFITFNVSAGRNVVTHEKQLSCRPVPGFGRGL